MGGKYNRYTCEIPQFIRALKVYSRNMQFRMYKAKYAWISQQEMNTWL